MPGINQTTKYSAASFQQFDGSNFTTVGIDNGYKVGDGNLGVYTGVGLSFNDKPASAIIDFKGSMPYGESPVSGGFRIRHNLSEESQSVQFRVQPATVTLPLSQTTSIYATPYVAAKYNYGAGDISASAGAYAGINQKVGDVNIFAEGQLYDVTKVNPSTTSFNIGVSIPIK